MNIFSPQSRCHHVWRMASAPALCALALVGINPALLCGQASRSTLSLAGLKAPVHVYRDTLGIPHIYASSSQDAYFALGYLHATDRLFEMEMFRRRASGTLAEVFGKASLDDDIFVRQIGIRRSTEAAWKSPRLDGRILSFATRPSGFEINNIGAATRIPSAITLPSWSTGSRQLFFRQQHVDQHLHLVSGPLRQGATSTVSTLRPSDGESAQHSIEGG